MKVACPKCSQRIKISPEVAAAIAGAATFDCPSCGASVPNPTLDRETLPPLVAEQLLMRALNSTNPNGGNWSPPEPSDLNNSIGERYHVTELIGYGGMGAVYKARDTRLDRLVAIKILPEELAQNPAILSRFEREAKSLAALDHPHIVKIHDYGFTSGGSPFFVMEFVRGRDIQSLRNEGGLDLCSALRMVSQVCDAIDYAHRRKIIHRDIKPANVIIDEQGGTKVADFGLAKLLETETRAHHQPDLTFTGQSMGTPAYMAPEQEAGASVDHRTDIYALGVMLYNLLTGSPPRGAWSLPSELASVDARLDQIVLRALQEKPEARYQSASEFREDIDSVIGDSGGAALPPGTESAPLPSSAGAKPITSGRFAKQHKTTVTLKLPQTQSTEAEFLSTARSLNNTMLLLGLLAMIVIGGLALYLANRKTGDVNTVIQTISSSVTHNTFFSQLIATGITTKEELEAIEDIRPYQDGFIGLSAAEIDWKEAEDLAKRTGAVVVDAGSDNELSSWLVKTFTLSSTSSAWILTRGDAGLLTSEGVLALKNTDGVRKVLLHWRSSKANPKISQKPEPESVMDSWIDTQGREIKARFLRLEGETLVINFKDKETRIPLSRLSAESRALAHKRHSESNS